MVKKAIIMTNRARLRKKYGNPGLALIEKHLAHLQIAHMAEGLDSTIFFIDDHLEDHDLLSARTIRTTLFGVVDKGTVGHLVVIGNDDIVPFFRVRNLLDPTQDPDRVIHSDMLYGCEDHREDDYFDFVPRIPVGRIPDQQDRSPEFLLGQLRRTIRHRDVTISGDPRHFFGCTTQSFRGMAEQALAPIGRSGDCHVSPPVRIGNIAIPSDPLDLMFFLLHGSDVSEYWCGESDTPRRTVNTLSPEVISRMGDGNTAFCMALPCYGGYIIGKTVGNSNALALLHRGAEAMICSTMLVWAGQNLLTGALRFGPRFARLLFENLGGCARIGDLMVSVKKHFIEEMADHADNEGASYIHRCLKTLMEFTLYGDPTRTIRFGPEGGGVI